MTDEVKDLLGRTVVHDTPDYEDRNYIVRHWVGAQSLAQSYWVNGVLIGLPLTLYLRVGAAVPSERPIDYFEWKFLPFLAAIILLVWQYVGIWRSAGNQIREGRPGWALVARFVVVIGTLISVRGVAVTARSTWSMWLAFVDERAATYTVTQRDTKVFFSGEITPESADRLEALLNKEGVDRLVIRQSIGGFAHPALRLADLIEAKKLTVIVESDCASGCTLLLAAGAQRIIAPETIIRLHDAYQFGTSDASSEAGDVEARYVRAGMGQDLLAKVRAHHGPRDLYEPTIGELITNGLVTDIFDVQTLAYVPAWQWCSKHLDACTRTGTENRAVRRTM
jgi:hypothetical protein